MKVKICGITRFKDALVSIDAGADYLGFVFYSSSTRAIDVTSARQLVEALRQRPSCPLLVGVFVNETAEEMLRIMEYCQLDLAQLSGEEVPYLVGDEKSPLYGRAYKALRPQSLAEAEVEAEWYVAPQEPAGQPSLLLDTYHPTLRGGTGATADWTLAAQLAQAYPGLMLAGGLNAANVAEAVRQVRPFAVDVASGVEASPGRKDHALVRAFIEQAKSA
jgi:phosphoribosylanthranilate isomerase